MTAAQWHDAYATGEEPSLARMSASVAAALALHAAAVALLAARETTWLELQPAPIVVTLFPAASRTEGPGAHSDELHVASAAAGPRAEPPATAANPVMSLPREPEDVAPPHPESVPRPLPKPAKRIATTAKPHATDHPDAAATPPDTDTGAIARGGTGTATSSGTSDAASAPSWAPAARIRYEELLFAWIDRHKEYPLLAQRRGIEGSGLIRVRIGRDGRLIDRSLVRSTGQPMLDDAALEMVRRSSPFPAVPGEYSGASFEFVAPVEYRLH
ncbi:MAG TPA: energy transducer TonB [Candidatus Limnocylindrales bacterium]|nr:energy transducer TonB [Candidatus Limnocylindrales bacterium]